MNRQMAHKAAGRGICRDLAFLSAAEEDGGNRKW